MIIIYKFCGKKSEQIKWIIRIFNTDYRISSIWMCWPISRWHWKRNVYTKNYIFWVRFLLFLCTIWIENIINGGFIFIANNSDITHQQLHDKMTQLIMAKKMLNEHHKVLSTLQDTKVFIHFRAHQSLRLILNAFNL